MNFNGATNKTVLDRYLNLKQPDDVTQCMYVWIDGTGEYLRAKTKTCKFVPKKPSGMYRATRQIESYILLTTKQKFCHSIHCWASCHSLGFEDEDLGSSPGWLAATVATYCPS